MKKLLSIAFICAFSANAAQAEIFGFPEVKDNGHPLYDMIKDKSINEWRDITKQYKRAIASGGLSSNQFRGDINKLRGKTRLQTVFNVNRYVNDTIEYRSDEETWDRVEYWANPIETTKNGSYGDCDDFALAKYFALKQLGIPDKDMRFVVLRAMNAGGEGHAVLLVKVSGENYILDNNLRNPVIDKKIKFYDPIYTVNNRSFELYKKLPEPKQKKKNVASKK